MIRGLGTSSRTRQWLNLAIGVIGVVVVLAGLFWVGRGPITCRGEVMGPGDVCRKGTMTDPSSDQLQSYEQRRASARASRPTVVGLGVALIAFSAALVVVDRRGRPDQDQSA